ncbi:Protein SMG5 [Armadillidium nasatum]|uniref:Protein SMG5 n=1 Tax=Armadillidium nasatum TaxID=96803 RepID=A0A5N5TAU4_9CRUS|nr:Protein SMG5 [Armadillidium nasatum]
MRKIANVSEEKAEGLESISKRITKHVSENVHKVDNIISSARSTASLFNIQAINARIRLRDVCERAILSGSSSTISQRIDEILWRKVYYDPLSTAKKIRQGSSWSEIEKGLIWTHLNDGIAFYHHLLMALSSSVNNSTNCKADLLPSFHHDYETIKKKDSGNSRTSQDDIFFRSLTCLGDLTRYMLDIPNQISSNNTYLLPVRYYHQALHYNCEGGLTHSNLATVYSTNNQPLLAALHYLRALTCEKPFEAAENNLKRMLDRSRIWLENRKLEYENHNNNLKEINFGKECTLFLHTCLALLSCFINNRKFEEVALLSRNALVQVSKLLDNYDNIEPTDISDASNNDNSSTPVKASAHTNASEALLVSLLLSLVSHIITRLEQRFSLIDPSFIQKLIPPQDQTPKPDTEEVGVKENHESSLCNGDNKAKKSGKRRLNKGGSSSSDEAIIDYDYDDTIDTSVLCSSEDDEETDEDVKIECEEEWEGMTEEEHVQLVEHEGMLAAVNVITQWIFQDDSTIKMCCKQNSSFWDPFAKLFNLLHIDYEKLYNSETINKERVLNKIREMTKSDKTEDEELKNLFGHLPESMMLHLVMPSVFQSSNQMHNLKPSEVNLLRVYRMNCIMEELCGREDTPLKVKEGKFIVSEEKVKDGIESNKVEVEASGGRSTPIKPSQLHNHNSGENNSDATKLCNSQKPLSGCSTKFEIWRRKPVGRMKLGGLYLVPDASVLIHHLSAVKQILSTPSHMVIIPQVVIDSLDQQKRDSLGARDAIRWLEAKLRYGSRFMRAQRPHEKSHLPLIKYPKRKDKEAWEWFHLAECCYYLGAQMNKTGAKTSTVTLLTAENTSRMATKKSFSLQTLAEAAGAVLMSVDEFVRKWQISTKGHS